MPSGSSGGLRRRRRRPDRPGTRPASPVGVPPMAAAIEPTDCWAVAGSRPSHEDDERAVEAGAEVLADQVVGLALRALRRGGGVVGQGELQLRRRDARTTSPARTASTVSSGRRVTSRVQRAPIEPPAPVVSCGVGRSRRAAREPGFGREPRPGEAEQRGQQGEGDEDGDQHGAGRADAHDGEERDADDGEAGQRDDDGQPGEDDRGAGGAGRPGRGLLRVHAGGQLGAVPGQDEQRVVDADGEADHQRERRRGRGQRDHVRRQQQPAHADADADDRRQQVHPGGEQRAEGQHEHEDRDDDADELGGADRDAGGAEGVAADGDLQAGVLGRGGGLLQGVEAASRRAPRAARRTGRWPGPPARRG